MGSFASTSSTPSPSDVLLCRPDSISFSESEEPIFSDPTTEKANNDAVKIIRCRGLSSTNRVRSRRRCAECCRLIQDILYKRQTSGQSSHCPYFIAIHAIDSAAFDIIIHTFSGILGAHASFLARPAHHVIACNSARTTCDHCGTVDCYSPYTLTSCCPSAYSARKHTSGCSECEYERKAQPHARNATHVAVDLGASGKLKLIFDGGVCDVGLTVVDGLREDGNIRACTLHRRDYVDDQQEQAPQTPGMKYRHYAPGMPVLLVHRALPEENSEDAISPETFLSYVEDASKGKTKIGLMACDDSPLLAVTTSSSSINWVHFPLGPTSTPATAAAHLFDGLHTLDAQGVSRIVAEAIVEEKEGLPFMNRTGKAAGTGGRVWLRVWTCRS